MLKALLVGLQLPGVKESDVENSLTELQRLAETAGIKSEGKVVQKKEKIDPAYFIGKGKASEIRDIVVQKKIYIVIFDEDLRPVQQKNIEKIVGVKIVDRTRLILDIFSQRARSREGKMQVERAKMEYNLSRLSKKGAMLDSQTGGIGTRRGPGEKKLETDQRVIRDKISALDKEIDIISKHRKILRNKRIDSGKSIVSIVGYTNAGKSTFLNTLCKNNAVYADDKLFATLDPTTRLVKLPGGRTVLFTDTVGFINKLPHSLIAAFRATLEEVTYSHCILHIIDASSKAYEKQMQTVFNVLKELKADNIPLINVYNKEDLISDEQRNYLEKQGAILISAKEDKGIEKLLQDIENIVVPKLYKYSLLLKYEQSAEIDKIFKWAVVKKLIYTKKGIEVNIESTQDYWKRIQVLVNKKYIL